MWFPEYIFAYLTCAFSLTSKNNFQDLCHGAYSSRNATLIYDKIFFSELGAEENFLSLIGAL